MSIDCTSRTVLLVDDNRVSREIATIVLKSCRRRVIQAVNGLEALEILLESGDINLIFMDVQMPVMDGLVTSSVIRACENGRDLSGFNLSPALMANLSYQRWKEDVTIVGLSANDQTVERQQGLDAGMNYFLNKPLQKDGVLFVLSRLADIKNVTPRDNAVPRLSATGSNGGVGAVFSHLQKTYGLGEKETAKLLMVSSATVLENIDLLMVLDRASDWHGLGPVAHGLKGSLLNLGLADLAAVVREIELKCREGGQASFRKELLVLRESFKELVKHKG